MPELAGLRKAAVDYIVREHTGADDNPLPGKLISFLRDNKDTPAELFPRDQRDMLGALARDAEAGMPAMTDGSALHNVARVLRRATIVGPNMKGQAKQGAAR